MSENLNDKRVLRLTWVGEKRHPSPMDSFFRVTHMTKISGGSFQFCPGPDRAEIMDLNVARAWLTILRRQVGSDWKIIMERPRL